MEQPKLTPKGKKTKQWHKELLSDQRVVKFLTMANKETGVGCEAAFIVAMAHAGGDVLRKLVFTQHELLQLHEPEDDLALAFRLSQLTQTDDGRQLLRKICKASGVKYSRMEKISKLANKIGVDYSSNLLFPELPDDGQFFFNHVQESFSLREANPHGLLVLTALSFAFCQAFDENLCTFYDIDGDGKGVFYSLSKGMKVKVPDHSAAFKRHPFPQINHTRMMAYSLGNGEDPGMLEANFVCRMPLSLQLEYPVDELLQLKLNIGPLVARKLLSSSNDFLQQQCGPLTFFQSYTPSNGVLAIACPAPSAQILRELAEGTMKDVFANLNVLRSLLWFDKNCMTLVNLGPGFGVSGLIPHPSEKDREAIVVKFPKQQPFVTGYLSGMFKQFCRSRGFNPLILDDPSNGFCAASLTPSIARELKSLIETNPITSTLTVELKFDNMFEYFAVSSGSQPSGDHPSSSSSSSFPTTDCACAICLCAIDRPYIRLSLCGHVYCDDCFIGLITKTTEFPVRCQSGCVYQILFEDIALVLSRNIADATKIQQLLEPVLRQSLEVYFQAHIDEFIRCQTENCNSLLKKGGEMEGTSGSGEGSSAAVMCQGCKTKRCATCGNAAHQGFTCNEKQAEKFAEEHPDLSQWKEELPEIRHFCPNIHCKMLIEKKAGCNHMECPRCNTHFCWVCDFQATSSRQVYDHMISVHQNFGVVIPDHDYWPEVDDGDENGFQQHAVEPIIPLMDPLSEFGHMVQGVFQNDSDHEGWLEHGDDDAAMFRHFMRDLEQYRQHGGLELWP